MSVNGVHGPRGPAARSHAEVEPKRGIDDASTNIFPTVLARVTVTVTNKVMVLIIGMAAGIAVAAVVASRVSGRVKR